MCCEHLIAITTDFEDWEWQVEKCASTYQFESVVHLVLEKMIIIFSPLGRDDRCYEFWLCHRTRALQKLQTGRVISSWWADGGVMCLITILTVNYHLRNTNIYILVSWVMKENLQFLITGQQRMSLQKGVFAFNRLLKNSQLFQISACTASFHSGLRNMKLYVSFSILSKSELTMKTTRSCFAFERVLTAFEE